MISIVQRSFWSSQQRCRGCDCSYQGILGFPDRRELFEGAEMRLIAD
jgi:hypothetical protein